MKTTKLILGTILFLGVFQAENLAVALTCAGVALGWYFYEKRNSYVKN